MKKFLALSLALMLVLSGCGPGPVSIENAAPEPQPVSASDVADEQPDLFRTVYRQDNSFGPTWSIIEFIPNGTLYLVRANNGGICPLVDHGGYNSTSPYTIRDFNDYLKKSGG